MDAVFASPQYEGAGGLEKAKKVCVEGKKRVTAQPYDRTVFLIQWCFCPRDVVE